MSFVALFVFLSCNISSYDGLCFLILLHFKGNLYDSYIFLLSFKMFHDVFSFVTSSSFISIFVVLDVFTWALDFLLGICFSIFSHFLKLPSSPSNDLALIQSCSFRSVWYCSPMLLIKPDTSEKIEFIKWGLCWTRGGWGSGLGFGLRPEVIESSSLFWTHQYFTYC